MFAPWYVQSFPNPARSIFLVTHAFPGITSWSQKLGKRSPAMVYPLTRTLIYLKIFLPLTEVQCYSDFNIVNPIPHPNSNLESKPCLYCNVKSREEFRVLDRISIACGCIAPHDHQRRSVCFAGLPVYRTCLPKKRFGNVGQPWQSD